MDKGEIWEVGDKGTDFMLVSLLLHLPLSDIFLFG